VAGSQLTVEIAPSIDAVSHAEWDAVVEASGAPVFYRYDVLRAYEQKPLQEIAGTRYLLARRNSHLMGVLPLYVLPHGRARLPGGSGVVLVTHAPHRWETCVPAAPQADASVMAALWETLRECARQAKAELVA